MSGALVMPVRGCTQAMACSEGAQTVHGGTDSVGEGDIEDRRNGARTWGEVLVVTRKWRFKTTRTDPMGGSRAVTACQDLNRVPVPSPPLPSFLVLSYAQSWYAVMDAVPGWRHLGSREGTEYGSMHSRACTEANSVRGDVYGPRPWE